jgi:hypothetical protein
MRNPLEHGIDAALIAYVLGVLLALGLRLASPQLPKAVLPAVTIGALSATIVALAFASPLFALLFALCCGLDRLLLAYGVQRMLVGSWTLLLCTGVLLNIFGPLWHIALPPSGLAALLFVQAVLCLKSSRANVPKTL